MLFWNFRTTFIGLWIQLYYTQKEGERLLKLSKLSNSKQLTNGFIKQLDCTSINIKIENFFCWWTGNNFFSSLYTYTYIYTHTWNRSVLLSGDWICLAQMKLPRVMVADILLLFLCILLQYKIVFYKVLDYSTLWQYSN